MKKLHRNYVRIETDELRVQPSEEKPLSRPKYLHEFPSYGYIYIYIIDPYTDFGMLNHSQEKKRYFIMKLYEPVQVFVPPLTCSS